MPSTTTNTHDGDHQRQAVQQQLQLSTTNRSVPTPTTTALQCTTARVPVLLQTARVSVFDPANPVILCYKQSLSLDRQCIKTMLIKTFGLEKGSKQQCDVVSHPEWWSYSTFVSVRTIDLRPYLRSTHCTCHREIQVLS